MRNKYAGTCFICEKEVKPNKGFFQAVSPTRALRKRFPGRRWVVRCEKCVGRGNKPIKNINEQNLSIEINSL